MERSDSWTWGQGVEEWTGPQTWVRLFRKHSELALAQAAPREHLDGPLPDVSLSFCAGTGCPVGATATDSLFLCLPLGFTSRRRGRRWWGRAITGSVCVPVLTPAAPTGQPSPSLQLSFEGRCPHRCLFFLNIHYVPWTLVHPGSPRRWNICTADLLRQLSQVTKLVNVGAEA